jgi:hypothetical protein
MFGCHVNKRPKNQAQRPPLRSRFGSNNRVEQRPGAANFPETLKTMTPVASSEKFASSDLVI